NHWCALIINGSGQTIHYGDPMGYLLPLELLEVLDWWIGLSFAAPFLKDDLPTGNQINTFSCSIHTTNALSHYFF
ncbi:hypothetical protein BYT27DRAFT_7022400, partial [Phlegmacium glaucopus]